MNINTFDLVWSTLGNLNSEVVISVNFPIRRLCVYADYDAHYVSEKQFPLLLIASFS